VNLFSYAVDENLPKPTINFKEEDLTSFDLLMEQRRLNIQQKSQQLAQAGIKDQPLALSKNQLPPELCRNYQIVIVPGDQGKKQITKLREVRAQQIGSLVTVRGIVTRASDVKPCIQVAVTACDLCGFEIY